MASNKRPRHELDDPRNSIDPTLLIKAVDYLGDSAIKQLLIKEASNNASIYRRVLQHAEEKKQAKLAVVVSFEHYVGDAEYALNEEHERKSSVKQFEIAHEVAMDIEESFKAMAKQAHSQASYGTKLNAIEAMREIMKAVCEADPSELSKQVRIHLYGLDDQFIKTLARFTKEDMDKLLMMDQDEDGRRWLDRMSELRRLSRDYGMFPKLKDVNVMVKKHWVERVGEAA